MDVTEKTETTEVTEKTETEAKPETVSKERFEEQQTKLKTAEEQNELLKANNALIAANVQPAAPQGEPFDIYKEVGLEGAEDIPNVDQSRKINAYYQAITQRQNAQLRFVADHPDFPKLVGTAQQIATGQWAAPLMKAIKANPTLMPTIVNSADPYAAAYAVAKIQTDKDVEGDKTKTTKTEAEQAIDEAIANAKKVRTSANAKGGVGLSEAGRTEHMSDADFVVAFNAHGGDL